MVTLKGKKVLLRALEPQDLDFLFEVENNEEFWELSATQIPFSKYTLQLYIENAHRDIYEAKQFRFVIEANDEPVGLLDVFDFDPQNRRAGIGIIVAKEADRKKGYALDSISLLKKYAFKYLNLHQLYANISADNQRSILLFEKSGFMIAGTKKDWSFFNGSYKDENLYQLINQDVH